MQADHPPPRWVSLCGGRSYGLSAIHEAGIIHRDLKAPNIMRGGQGVIRLMDLGIARELESVGVTMAGQVMGTPEYLSPEQALGHKLDFRTDLYSMGIVAFELLPGGCPSGATPRWPPS